MACETVEVEPKDIVCHVHCDVYSSRFTSFRWKWWKSAANRGTTSSGPPLCHPFGPAHPHPAHPSAHLIEHQSSIRHFAIICSIILHPVGYVAAAFFFVHGCWLCGWLLGRFIGRKVQESQFFCQKFRFF